jgi:hypothetical protein
MNFIFRTDIDNSSAYLLNCNYDSISAVVLRPAEGGQKESHQKNGYNCV